MDEDALHMLLERPVERRVLGNGLTVIHTPDKKAPVVSVQVWVKTGSIHEGQWLGCGLSHYLEHMLFKGTSLRSFAEISGQVQAMGGNINAYTTFNRTVYYIDAPTESFSQALALLADMIYDSRIDSEEAARERNVILREIEMGNDDPDRRMMQRVFGEVFRKHPFGLPVIGERALFETISREELWTYYRERYAPNNLVLSIGGDVGEVDLFECIEQAFGQEPMRRLAPVWIPSEPAQLAQRVCYESGNYQVARGSVAYRVPGLHDADAPALDLLATVLGHGNSSLLWKRLRDDLEWVHSIDASCWNPGEQGMLWISYLCDNGREQDVAEEVTRLLETLDASTVSVESLRKAQKRAFVALVNSFKTASGMASRSACYEVVAGDIAYPKHYYARLAEQTPESVLAVAKHYCIPSGQTQVHLTAPSGIAKKSDSANAVGQLPDFEQHTLANGIRVLLQPTDGLPKVHLRAVMLGGPLYEEEQEKGASALLSTMLARDTQRLSAYAVAQEIESVGGTFHEFAGNNTFGLSLEVLQEDIPLAVRLLSEAIREPRFLPKTFALERDGQIAHIREMMDDMVEFARTRLRQRFFGSHPYATDALGTPESLAALDLNSLQVLYQRLVVPGNLILSISGRFESSAMLEALSEAFGSLEGGAFTRHNPGFTAPSSVGKYLEHFEGEQTVVQCAFPDVGICSDSYYTGEVLDELLSGMASRLFEQVRERRGLAYYVYAMRMLGLDCGMFTLCAGTTYAQHEEVLALMHEELSRIRTSGVSEAELARCRMRLTSQKHIQQQSPSARTMNAALNLAYGLPVNLWREYDERLAAVDADALAAFTAGFDESSVLTLVTSPNGEGALVK